MGSPARAPYPDRAAAGDAVAAALVPLRGRPDLLVLGLPRGGLPVAARVAAALDAPLDALMVRKLGVPRRPEVAMGAVAHIGGRVDCVRNDPVLRHLRIDEATFAAVREREAQTLLERERRWRGDRPATPVRGRLVVVVDDGLATGTTVRAAVAALRRQEPARVVVAAPVGAADSAAEVAAEVDELVCPWIPRAFVAVGLAYRDFRPTTDAEVVALLDG